MKKILDQILNAMAIFAMAFFAIQGNKTVGKLAFSFLLITMITALGLEFFARPEPKMILVIIATLLTAISIYKLNAKTQ
ncbi:hypothetical protein N6H18_12660 [Reichenbachiella agarivorans]|uniref:Uncharacterized protein n=1 Tax=Reichenbachiella agarivorans TaxID=2979464 RepID=A0ABY6CSD8_9BACT|nr:hypothetical protein [Reichenbachiella agarivorans]UXP31200.1 hypothetical protein N6H18_12660 [Reichenbachiella agarivorans]